MGDSLSHLDDLLCQVILRNDLVSAVLGWSQAQVNCSALEANKLPPGLLPFG